MPRPVPTSTSTRIDKRTAILDAALDLFSEHTFDGTAVPLIAERAHVGAGTIYRYFESKEALVNAVYRHWKGEMTRRLVDEAPHGVSGREGFAHWWRGLWAFATEHPKAFAFLETHHHAPYLESESTASGEGLLDGARALIREYQRRGEMVQMDPDTMIALVTGAFTGLAKSTGDRGVRPSPQLIGDTEARVWEMLRA